MTKGIPGSPEANGGERPQARCPGAGFLSFDIHRSTWVFVPRAWGDGSRQSTLLVDCLLPSALELVQDENRVFRRSNEQEKTRHFLRVLAILGQHASGVAGVESSKPHRHQVKEPPVFQKEEVLP